jgi:hypothetical protein
MWFCLSASAADLAVGPAQPYSDIGDALRDAASGDRILVDPGDYEVREAEIEFQLEILSVAGPGQVTLEGSNGQSLFEVSSGGDLTLRDLTIEGDGRRLAVVDAGRLAVLGCTVTGAEAAGLGRDGGVVDASSATLVFEDSVIEGAVAGRDGGVVHATGTDVTATRSTFRGASAGDGGVFALAGGSLTVDASVFEANRAGRGSVFALDATPATVSSSTFLANVATTADTLACDGAPCVFDRATFDGNVAPRGAVASANAGFELSSSTVCRTGGERALDVVGGALVLRNDVFVSNGVGTALVSASGATVDVLSVHFVANTATGPGAALSTVGSAVTLRNTLVAYNTAGGPVVDVPTADLSGGWSLFWGNETADLVGALRATDVAADPLFPAPPPASCNAALLAPPLASPTTDAGDPALVDQDGSRSDIGAFGGNDDAPVVVIDDDADGWPASLDCDDAEASVYPTATEVACDGVDQDCDPTTVDAPDRDGDGVGICDGDCDDTNANRTELVDVYRDRDEDGVGTGDPTTLCGMPAAQASLVGGDCDDQDADRFPGNPELPYDGVDQDCDGADLDDVDLDGVVFPDDCDDDAPDVFPGADEVEGDGVDQDCTGFDARAALVGGAGITCGCNAQGTAAVPLFPVLVSLLRRRRLTSRSGTR